MLLSNEVQRKIEAKKRKAEEILKAKKISNNFVNNIPIKCENISINSEIHLNKMDSIDIQYGSYKNNSEFEKQLKNSYNAQVSSNNELQIINIEKVKPENYNNQLFIENIIKHDLHLFNENIGKTIFEKIKITFYLISRERFLASCSYNSSIIQIFKSIQTRQYDPVNKIWNFDLKDYFSLKKILLEKLNDQIELEDFPKFVTMVLIDRINGSNVYTNISSANLSKVDEKLVRTLHPFQREAINFGIHQNGRLMIADDMGLGKTLQAICLAAYYKCEWPLLIITPSSVRFNWQQQILHWLPSLESCNIIVALKSTHIVESFSSAIINICSYDLMSRCHQSLSARNYKVIIVDESHCLKNIKAARTKNALPILKKAKRVILLSGTPALSRPVELFPQLSAISPQTFSTFQDYATRYCDAKETPWGWDYTGSSNLNELKIILETKFIIRRMKKDVLNELPAKCRTMILLDPSAVKLDQHMKNAHIVIEKTKCKEKAALLEYFHQTGNAKIPAVNEYISDLLENDRKFIIFAHHQTILNSIENTIKSKNINYIRIDGQTNSEKRNFFCKKFQNDESVKVAILSITAANAGIDLSSATLVVFAELFWNPGILVQAEDRAHRIGQKDSVSIQYLVAKNTADDFLWAMIQEKMDLLTTAGLCGDNFGESDTKQLQGVSDQSLITQYFNEDEFMMDVASTFFDDSSETK